MRINIQDFVLRAIARRFSFVLNPRCVPEQSSVKIVRIGVHVVVFVIVLLSIIRTPLSPKFEFLCLTGSTIGIDIVHPSGLLFFDCMIAITLILDHVIFRFFSRLFTLCTTLDTSNNLAHRDYCPIQLTTIMQPALPYDFSFAS